MTQRVHDQLMEHYRTKSNKKDSKNIKIESVVKQTFHKKVNEEDHTSPFHDFLRN